MNPTTFPYLTAPLDAVVATDWVVEGQEKRPDGSVILPGWDYNTTISAVRSFAVDVGRVRAACHLSEGDRLQLLVDYHASSTNLRGSLLQVELNEDRLDVSADVKLPGRELGGVLTISSRILVRPTERRKELLAASRNGSILWSDTTEVILEGAGGRFPIEVIDFQTTPPFPPNGAWFLDWDADRLDLPVLGGVRLFINQRNEAVLKAVTAPTPDAVDILVRSAVYFDVGRTMLRGALQIEDFVHQTEPYPAESVGRALTRMATVLFPGESLRSLKSLSTDRSNHFDVILQEQLKLFTAE